MTSAIGTGEIIFKQVGVEHPLPIFMEQLGSALSMTENLISDCEGT